MVPMVDSGKTPLCGQQIFLYPGDPQGTGIIEYDSTDYVESYDEIEFIGSSQFIRSLDDEIILRNRSLMRLADGERFYVPEYQRNFSWRKEQHEELWETALSILSLQPKSKNLPSDTYFGTVYVAQSPQGERYEIIDGQQRLATISILLKNISTHLQNEIESVDGELAEYATHIQSDYIDELLYRRKGPNEVPFIVLNDHDQPFYELLFKGDEEKVKDLAKMERYDGRKQNAIRLKNLLDELEISEDIYKQEDEYADEALLESFRYYGDAHKALVEADKFYYNKIADFIGKKEFDTSEKKVRALVNLAHYILRSLRVAECLFKTDDQELRIEVFQSLNDRGVELSKMDKVRARIVGRFQGETDSEKQVDRWESVVRLFASDADSVENFLAHYLAATEKSFETVTDARNNMLDAFRLKQFGQQDVRSRLASPGDARDFLEELESYAKRYQEIANSELVDEETKLQSEYREECEAILRRLNGLNTRQWRPFVMYVYQEVVEAPGKGDFFRDILKTIENITFRVAISDHVATVVDDTYPKSCQEFRELEQSDNQFNVERITEILIENIDDSARQVFGEAFVDTLVSTKNWRNNQTKQLFLKVADENFREENQIGITSSELSEDPSEVHIEHVFPQSFLLPNKENPYAWLEHFFNGDDSTRLNSQIDSLRKKNAHELDENEDEFEAVESLISNIREDFVRDIGNMILLDEAVNRPIKNRLFGVKLREYHKTHEKDMNNVINEYLNRTNIPTGDIDELIETDVPSDETASDSPPILQKYNEWWNYERMIERKSQLIREILDSLTFSTRKEEFEIFVDGLDEIVENDIETRFTVLTI